MGIDFKEKYPLLFRNKDAMQPINMFGNECAKGWDFLLDETFRLLYSRYKQAKSSLEFWKTAQVDDFRTPEKIAESIKFFEKDVEDRFNELPIVVQCKSKFGSLRLYCDNLHPYASGVIDMAEVISAYTCEVCGEKGKPTGGRWITTLCEVCEKKEKKPVDNP